MPYIYLYIYILCIYVYNLCIYEVRIDAQARATTLIRKLNGCENIGDSSAVIAVARVASAYLGPIYAVAYIYMQYCMHMYIHEGSNICIYTHVYHACIYFKYLDRAAQVFKKYRPMPQCMRI